MRYWGLFAGKLAISGAISYGLLLGINSFWPARFPGSLARVNRAAASLPIGRTETSTAPPRNLYVGEVRLLLPEDIPVPLPLKVRIPSTENERANAWDDEPGTASFGRRFGWNPEFASATPGVGCSAGARCSDPLRAPARPDRPRCR